MTKILLLKGLPASGKTTFGKELADNGWARINKDDIRAMINNSKWSKENEKQVIIVRDTLIRQYLLTGYNVVVDDTNLDPKHEFQIKSIADELNTDFELKFFDVPVNECIRRDSLREKPVGKKVIWDMYSKYIYKPDKFKEWKAEEGKPKAIIVDIDGTLAHMNGRTPFDYSKVSDDICDVFVKDLVDKYERAGFDILVVSGRESSCRDTTRDWLWNNNILAKGLFMRKAGDHREDSIVKKEIYQRDIEPYWSVFFCIDDRPRVVRIWHELGLKVFNCSDTGVDF